MKWLESPQPINNGFWLDYKKSPAWYLKGLGEDLMGLFKKIENTHPLHTSVRQVDEGLANRKPKDLATLTIEIIDGMRAVRNAEEGVDEANVLDTEANEFATEGDYITMPLVQSLAGIPMQQAQVLPQEELDLYLDSKVAAVGPTQRTLNPVSEVLDDSIIEKQLLEKIEGKGKSVFRDFEALMDQIINSKVELKTDIWGKRTGEIFKTEIFVAVINLYKELSGRVPLRDAEALSYWLYNANSLNRDFLGDRVVRYDTQGKEDIRVAFDMILRTFTSMDLRLGKWLGNLERALKVKEHIGLVRQPVTDLQVFIWSYRTSFRELFSLIDEGIKLPSSIINS
ncbi:hypothetical protein TWF718_010151 [Orbilia javanica]|uniref:Uncharacterized protein n=1 Tax=Orbilia javanica TaxID=47235 RepID=A0AAN8NP45_9PEZI